MTNQITGPKADRAKKREKKLMAKRKTPDWERLRELVRRTDKAVLTKVVQCIDGHTIYDPKQFTELGLDAEIVEAHTKTMQSGDHPKEQITSNKTGKVVKSMKGVYGLYLLEFIARTFGVDSWKMGRGSRAGHLAEQLIECNFEQKATA